MTYEKTQLALLKLLDSMKPDLDSSELANLGGLIGVIHIEPDKSDIRLSKAVLAIGDTLAKVNNNRGFKYGLSLSAKAIRTQPPVVELIDLRNDFAPVNNRSDFKPGVGDCQILKKSDLIDLVEEA